MKRLRKLNDSETATGTISINNSGNNIHIPSSSSEEKQLLEDSLVVSINGIAQGMKNSG